MYELKMVEGPVVAPAAGDHEFYYQHPPTAAPVMIDLIAAQLVTGTGAWCEIYLRSAGTTMRINKHQLTADYPFGVCDCTPFMLYKGETIKVRIRGMAAADTVECMIRGH